MSLRAAIHSVLAADTDVGALIGAGEACRHYPERAAQEVEVPFVVSSEIAGDPHVTHGQPGDAEDTMDETQIQFTCFADTVAAAIAVRSAVRAALLNDAGGIFAAAHIVVTSPTTRFSTVDEVETHGAQLDVTFFHNPNT